MENFPIALDSLYGQVNTFAKWRLVGLAAITQTIDIAIVIERRDVDHPWKDHDWTAVAVQTDVAVLGDDGAWHEIGHGDGWVRYLTAPMTLEVFGRETEGYKYNLSNDTPSVYVVWRADDDSPAAMSPFIATVSPYEAQSYLDGDEDLVEAVPMPADVAAWLAAFIESHHVDEPFHKRKRKRHIEDEPPRQGRAEYRDPVWRHG